MSIRDKATYILYEIAYLALGFWALRGFLKIAGSSNNFPKADRGKHIKNSDGA
jgi:hypothetical protein